MNRLKELRKEKGLTQKELADEIGTTKLTVSNWENEKHVIKSDKAQALADHFGVSVAYLLGYKEPQLDDLLEKILELKKYRCINLGKDIYINEADVIELVSGYFQNGKDSNEESGERE